ncbi:MAG: flavodoxin-dependent (E)-4-hydroxy-3-methylbut-2-enyl-diphosphate synthase [Spirochaetales bacterium]|nr:flavodoxin-dependent (E)-4-hydroxy-3-methylbut-2-enyl-diphosphate synthase [Spirochaetales bacterium]
MRDSIVMPRRKTRQIMVGDVPVGGDAPIAVQSMTNTLTTDIDATVAQVQSLEEAGADIVGANCGKGYDGMKQIIEEIRAVLPDIPIIIQANAGLPELINGVSVFPASPDEMAGQKNLWIEAGVNIIGGCCGTTDKHIRAIRDAVDAGI